MQRRISLIGDAASLDGIFEDGRFVVTFVDKARPPLVWTADRSGQGGHGGGDSITMLEFLDACVGRAPPPISNPGEAMRGLCFALAAEQSRIAGTVARPRPELLPDALRGGGALARAPHNVTAGIACLPGARVSRSRTSFRMSQAEEERRRRAALPAARHEIHTLSAGVSSPFSLNQAESKSQSVWVDPGQADVSPVLQDEPRSTPGERSNFALLRRAYAMLERSLRSRAPSAWSIARSSR